MGTAIAAIATVAGPAWAASGPQAPTSPVETTYSQAVLALPGASKALSAARTAASSAAVEASNAQSTLAQAETGLIPLAAVVRDARTVASAAQAHIDTLARQMYISGGAAPSLAETIVSTPADGSLADTLSKQAYLESAASHDARTAQGAVESLTAAETAYTQGEQAIASERQAAESADAAKAAADTTLAATQAEYDRLKTVLSIDPSAGYGDVRTCGDWLVKALYRAGFRGEDLREAWSIAMRESGGREDAISSSGDYGVFQFNKVAWGNSPYWGSDELMLTREWNIAQAFTVSQGGRTWYPWGLDGKGAENADAYRRVGWSEEMIQSHIVEPYQKWYALYPCRASNEAQPPTSTPASNWDTNH